MKLQLTLRKATELGFGITAISTLILAGCGASGSGTAATATSTAVAQTTTTIVPYKGMYKSGTVKVVDATGATVGTGSIGSNGTASVSYNQSASYPLTIQVTGTYINEATGTTESTTTPIRSFVQDEATATAASGIPVTAVTEVAVAQVAASNGGKLTGVSAASAVASFAKAETLLGLPNGAATSVPVFNSSGQTSDANTLKLAALAVSAQSNGTGADLAEKLAKMASNLTASTYVPKNDPILANVPAALTSVTSGAKSVLPSGSAAPSGLTFVAPASSVAAIETSASPANSQIGSWILTSGTNYDESIAAGNTDQQSRSPMLTFFANGKAMMNQAFTFGGGDVNPGLELGSTYSWDKLSNTLTVTCPMIDTNGSAGFSGQACPNSGTFTNYTINGNAMTITNPTNGNKNTFTRVTSSSSPGVGSWYVTLNGSPTGAVVTYTQYGDYYLSVNGGTAATSGLDFGTYTWNATTGVATINCPTVSQLGSKGFAGPSDATGGATCPFKVTVSISGNMMTSGKIKLYRISAQ